MSHLTSRRRRPSLRGALIGAAAIAAVGFAPLAASAAPVSTVSPSEQWITDVTGTVNTAGIATFGTTGVTATVGGMAGSCGGTGTKEASNANLLSRAGNDWYTPQAPANAVGVVNCRNGTTSSQEVVLSKPILGLLFHENNLDASWADLSPGTGGGAIALTTVSKNPPLELRDSADVVVDPGTRVISSSGGGAGGTCTAPAGGGQDPTCGTFRMTEAGGAVTSFTVTNVPKGSGADGWYFSLSFHTVPITAAFGVPAMGPGGITSLTYTLVNANDPGAVPLSPVDFTGNLPPGVTLADGSVTTSGCGSPTATDAADAPLASGGTNVKATGISLAVGATCTVAFNVTATATGFYAISPADTTSTIGNVVSLTDTTLDVAEDFPVPLAQPLAIAGALVLAVGGALVVTRRRRAANARSL